MLKTITLKKKGIVEIYSKLLAVKIEQIVSKETSYIAFYSR